MPSDLTTSRPINSDIAFIKANKPAIIEALKVIRDKELEDKRIKQENLKNQNVKVTWMDGSPLSGYTVTQNKELLLELGLAKEISGWGTLVDEKLVEALGQEFTAEQAREYVKPIIEKAAAAKKVEEEKINSAIVTAKALGHKIEIGSYTTNCNGSVEECDTDIITKYINGKGEITYSRTHMH